MMFRLRRFNRVTTVFIILLMATASIAAGEEAEPCDCIETMPGIGNPSVIYEDNAPAVWVGGDFIVGPNFAETEGLTVVRGDLLVQHDGLLGVGVVGVGSGIVPTPDSVMLAVGGDLIAQDPNRVRIGAAIPAGTISALALIGGEASGDIKALYNDGTEDRRNILEELGASATAHWSGFEEELKAESTKLKLLEPTGTVESIWDVAVFTSTNISAPLQVFTISAGDLADFSSWGGFEFWDIPRLENGRFTPIVVNVIGESASMLQMDVRFDGERVDDKSSTDFGNAASAILWNFVDAKELVISGTSQTMGSIIAPFTETVTITTHTNGRLFVNGDLTRSGTGTEHHNYPWTGGGWWFTHSHEAILGVPTGPEEPEDIEDPEDTAEPEDPTEPEDPEEPIPGEPLDPEDPEAPVEPTPVDPGDPEEKEESTPAGPVDPDPPAKSSPVAPEEPTPGEPGDPEESTSGEPDTSDETVSGDPATTDEAASGDHGTTDEAGSGGTGTTGETTSGAPAAPYVPTPGSPAVQGQAVSGIPAYPSEAIPAGSATPNNAVSGSPGDPGEAVLSELVPLDVPPEGHWEMESVNQLPRTGDHSKTAQWLIVLCCFTSLGLLNALAGRLIRAKRYRH